jgi:hypothetical protein
MHKSILTFLLLASSLVMLTVMPFLNNNNSFSPTEAKAESEYGMDNYKKYKDSSNVEEIIECSNTNVNNNGFNGVQDDTLPTALKGLATNDEVQASDEGKIGANSLGSSSGSDGGRQSGSDTDSRVVCINNNLPLEPPVEEPPVEECTEAEANAIEVCFEENMSPRDFGLLTNALENGITVETEEGNSVTLNSFADICKALKGITTWEQLFTAVLIITDEFSDPTAPVAISNDLIDCIAEALGIPLPSPPPGG